MTVQPDEIDKFIELVSDEVPAQEMLAKLKQEQPYLFEWVTHQFQVMKRPGTLLGIAFRAMALLEGNGRSGVISKSDR